MKILAFSDTHGYIYYPEFYSYPECDVICVAGDIIPLSIQSNIAASAAWLKDEFIPSMISMLDATGAKVCLITPGNHDFVFETKFLPEFPENIKVLIDQEYVYDYGTEKKYFYGTPWCNMTTRSKWAFDTKDEELLKKYIGNIPQRTEVLLTHCPPSSMASQQLKNNGMLVDYGNFSLSEYIKREISDIELVICGHIHECLNDDFKYNDIRVCNVAVKNENYYIYKEPKIIEI